MSNIISKQGNAHTTLSQRDGEYRIRLFIFGEHQAGSDYFTDDRQDAIATAHAMVKDAKPSDPNTPEAKSERYDYALEVVGGEEAYDALKEAFQADLDAREEYETSHGDAGGNYSHLLREGDTYAMCERLKQYLESESIPFEGVDWDEILEMVLSDFEMRPTRRYSTPNTQGFDLESYEVGEIESQYCFDDTQAREGFGLDSIEKWQAFCELLRQDNDFCVTIGDSYNIQAKENVKDGEILAYVCTDAFWSATISKEALLEWIADKYEETANELRERIQ